MIMIATALAANADCIVTGDKDLLTLGEFGTVRLLTARDFLTALTGE
jgi:predicted nucleic acid-binding protein